MARKAKVFTFDEAQSLMNILAQVNKQEARNPISKIEVAAVLDVKAGSLTDDYRAIERLGFAERRTGPDKRGIYLRMTAKGRTILNTWIAMFG